ncbi:transcription factor HES-2-like [Pseudophryne corroboree]|uniref:transcription factor HES-2-like n=1 Tax=Pseudophryne corroboree TaxID=495146 RepID=UPI0030816A45
MAPISNRMEDTESHMGKDMRKLRKPVIEKMRRDRINSSIEQLRMLLEKEFQKQQLPSKPEKADILEMTVNLLRQQLHRVTKAVTPYNQAFPTPAKQAEFFPSSKHVATETGLCNDPQKCRSTKENVRHPLATFNQGIIKQVAQPCGSSDLWRPW